jgi:hypothetical protein
MYTTTLTANLTAIACDAFGTLFDVFSATS